MTYRLKKRMKIGFQPAILQYAYTSN
ncbi:TPA: hypothetical protein ACIINQ_003792, partial [Salmonella enterica subsp. enterica serovar Typhimurium]